MPLLPYVLIAWKFRCSNEPFGCAGFAVHHTRARLSTCQRCTSVLLCMSGCASFVPSVCHAAAWCPSARFYMRLQSAQGMVPLLCRIILSSPHIKTLRVLLRGCPGPLEQEDPAFPQESRQLCFYSISLHRAAAGRAHGSCSSCFPSECQQIQAGCRDTGTSTNAAPLWHHTRDPRGPGPQPSSHPHKCGLRSSCQDRPATGTASARQMCHQHRDCGVTWPRSGNPEGHRCFAGSLGGL